MKHLLLFAALLFACTPDDPGPSATDAAIDGATDAASDTAIDASPMCCPMVLPTSCGCFSNGERNSLTGACQQLCDAVPGSVTQMTGADGCPYWRPSSASCTSSRPDGSVSD